MFVTSIYPQKIEFFPEILQTNPKNNYGIIFITEKLFLQRKYFVVHQGKEGFYLKLKNPLRFKNQILSVSGKCTVIEGAFEFFLVLKKVDSNVLRIPAKQKFFTENNLNSYELVFDEKHIISILRQGSTKHSLQDIFHIELIGFLIRPFSFRTVFYCEEFYLDTKLFIIDTL